MAGHPSDPVPVPSQKGVFTTSEIDADQKSGTKSTEELPSQDSLKDEITPATALELELDLDFLAGHPEFDYNPDDIDWDSFFPWAIDDNAPKASQEPNDLDNENPEEKFLESPFAASAAQLESHSLPGFPNNVIDGAAAEQSSLDKPMDDSAAQSVDQPSPGFPSSSNHEAPAERSLNILSGVSATHQGSHSLLYFPNTPYVSPMPQTQFASAKELNPASQDNTVDPADLLIPGVTDSFDIFGLSDSLGSDLNESSPASFEFPDTLSGLDFLQSLHLIGGKIQPFMSPDVGYSTQQLPHSTTHGATQGYGSGKVAWNGSSSASRVALAGSSEPNLQNETRAVLTNPRRLSKGYQGGPTQRPSDKFRIQQNQKYIQNRAYTPLKAAPESWDIFQYTKHGELDPSRLFSAEEINRLLFTHPLHRGHRNLKESQLRLRVHKTPAASAKRFPNGLKCRFKDCPMRTINQGQYLLVLDELSVQHPDHDFFLNAAYFHLYCMERLCNFQEICAKMNVSAKGRDSRKEEGRKNRFCLTLGEEERVVEDFVKGCCANGRRGNGLNPWVAICPDEQTNGFCPHYEQPSLPYKGTLSHQLAVTKLHYGGRGRITLRKGREDRAGYEGANIIRHLGDLSKEAELREYSRTHRNQNQLKSNPKARRYYRGDEIEEGEQSDDSHSEPSCPPAIGSPYQAHGTKRIRDEVEDDQTRNQDIAQPHKKSKHHGPHLSIPEWNSDQSRKIGIRVEGTVDAVDSDGRNVGVAMTPEISPRTTLTSTISEGEREEDLELEMLAAQRRRRALEIEDAKDQEKECRLRKLKLQRADEKKRARDEGSEEDDGIDSRAKRQRV